MLYRYIGKIGQDQLQLEFLGLMIFLAKKADDYFMAQTTPGYYVHNRTQYEDDLYRGYLKQISSFCFPKVFTHGPAFMWFCHLHALTGKCPYTPEQIISDIETWVSDRREDGKPKHLDEHAVKKTLDKIFSSWTNPREYDGHLSFEEYSNDFMRWGTSGGAPKVEIKNEKYRTKWAWAYEHATDKETMQLKENYSLYNVSKENDKNISKIALKEEAQKTREIITTPMPSYLRQAYLLYRWGKPPLPSPISSGQWTAHFETTSPSWYGCIDGDRFDQTIPAWFIRNVIDRLGNKDAETRAVADEELKSLDTLRVEWRNQTWGWNAGVLSGWRLTSLFGTLASVVAAEYIIEKSNTSGGIQYGALGDDLILYSYNSDIPNTTMVELYNEFGLVANIHKTTSGSVGEFLRKVTSRGGSWGYPALALRSVVYANPWIAGYNFEKEAELSTTWLTFISRLIPHSVVKIDDSILCDLVQNLKEKFGPGRWEDWLHTPISAGGGGSIEFSDPSRWTYLQHRVKDPTYVRKEVLFIPTMLGIYKSKLVFEKTPTFSYIDYEKANSDAEFLRSHSQAYDTGFKHSTNITRAIFDFASGKLSRAQLNKLLRFPLPRSVANSSVMVIVEYLFFGGSKETGYTSICHTKEMISTQTTLSKFLSRAVSLSKRFSRPQIIKPAVTMYFVMTYSKHRIPFGTW